MSDVTESYMDRVRAHMDGLPPCERLAFLQAQRSKFLIEYERFEQRMAKGKPPREGETATEYVLTIAELGKAIGEQEGKAVMP